MARQSALESSDPAFLDSDSARLLAVKARQTAWLKRRFTIGKKEPWRIRPVYRKSAEAYINMLDKQIWLSLSWPGL